MAQPVTAAPTPSLTKTLVSLQWKLLLRSYRKNWGKIIGTIFGIIYALGIFSLVTAVLVSMLFVPSEAGAFVKTIQGFGVIVILGWTVLSLTTFGVDDTLSPTKFAQFGRGPKDVQFPIFLASLISVGFLTTALATLVACGVQIVWLIAGMTGNGADLQFGNAMGALVVLIPMNLIGLLLCALIPRAVWSWRDTWRLSKRKSERIQALTLVGVLTGVYGFSAFSGGGENIMKTAFKLVEAAVSILLWTPFGAPFAAPLDFAEGHYLEGIARIVITAVSFVLLWKWWGHSFAEAQLQALKGAGAEKAEKEGTIVPKFMKPGPLAAATGRSLRYWRRDTRYSVGYLILPVLAIFFLVISVTVPDNKMMAYVGVALVAWLGGITVSNEIGYDGPAGWVNIVAGIDNRANLVGRYIAAGMLYLPATIIMTIAAPLLHNEPPLIGLTLPAALGFLLSSAGVSALTSVLLPYKAPKPGSFKNSEQGMTWLALFAAMFGTWIPMLPVIALIVVGLFIVPGLEFAGSALALVIGLVTFVLFIRMAAKHLDAHYVDEFQKVREFAG